MNERLLQFIWGAGHFNKNFLQTDRSEHIEIIDPGKLNVNQGPDFLDARIRINGTVWVGSVELHIYPDDWDKHGHGDDENYRNVILHVVWQNKPSISISQQSIKSISILELAPRVSKILLAQYEQWMNLDSFIPCQSSLGLVDNLHWQGWKERILVERWQRKTARVKEMLLQNLFHWEETCWWMIARNFGNPVNADAFEAMARSVPINIIWKHRSNIIQLEAILLGQAGLLNGRYKEGYSILLQKEYRYQREKYKLRPILMPVHFLRMRPGNFPTIRLAQLAMLMHQQENIFAGWLEANDLDNLKKDLDIVANDHWHYHYRLDELSNFRIKRMGESMIDNLVMNTVCLMLFTYGQHLNDQPVKEKAIHWLKQLAPENNRIIRKFNSLGIISKNAFDSQALLELKTSYCDLRKCLDCGIGRKILGASF